MALADDLTTAASAGVETLLDHTRCVIDVRETHTVCRICDLRVDVDLCRAIGRYAVVLRANLLDAALRVQRFLVPDSDAMRMTLAEDVSNCCGSGLSETDLVNHVRDRRNPWLSESLAHMFMNAAQANGDIHPPGRIIGAWSFHTRATDPGVDVAALYDRSGTWGLSIIEAKACENNAPSAVQDAVRYFREVDEGHHSDRLRQAATYLSVALRTEDRTRFSQLVWQQERAYVANPYYQLGSARTTWRSKRPRCQALAPERDRIVFLACPIDGFSDFFERIATEALTFAQEL